MTGLYVPGQSWLHRQRAWLKLLVLFLLGAALIVIDQILVLGATLFVIGFIFVVVGDLGVSRLWTATRPLLPWLAVIFVAQIWLADVASGLRITVRLVALVWAAALVTHTTRLTEMSDVFAGILQVMKPLGVSPDRIAFLCALTIRLVPALFDTLQQVREAQRARGIERSYVTAFVPVLIQVIRQADTMSDALVARGFDRWDEK